MESRTQKTKDLLEKMTLTEILQIQWYSQPDAEFVCTKKFGFRLDPKVIEEYIKDMAIEEIMVLGTEDE